MTVSLLAHMIRLSALAAAIAGTPACAAPEIAWRVHNPFRLFSDPADTEMHRATLLALPPEQRAATILSSERALGGNHADGWAALMMDNTCWDRARNLYVCSSGENYINPEKHEIVAAIRGIEDAQTVDCTWLTQPLGGQKRRGRAVTQPCDAPISLFAPFPEGMRLTVEIGARQVADTLVRVTDLLIVGLGDSYASGEGNPDLPVRFSRERAADYGSGEAQHMGYPARVGPWKAIGDPQFIKENARWLDQACHRSLYSYQLRSALQLAIEEPHRAVTFVGLACSGAEIVDGLFLRYKGHEWVPNPPELSQISAAAQAQCGAHEAPQQVVNLAYQLKGQVPALEGGLVVRKCAADRARKIDLVFLSVGGNDIGFSRVLANAVLASSSLLKRLGGWFGHVHGAREAQIELATLDERYKALNRALHSVLHIPWSETDRILLTAYPGVAFLEDGKTVCPDGRAGMDVVADLHLSTQKAREGSAVAEELNRIMRMSAQTHGWTFVERHRQQFLGRGVCAGFSEYAFSSADDLRLPRKIGAAWEPYNPADYQPYVSRQRWFRTPNDAFMTGNFHASGTLFQQVLGRQTISWFQLLLAATYSGAFHPTAEGHAAIADAVVEQARDVLAKYGRQVESR